MIGRRAHNNPCDAAASSGAVFRQINSLPMKPHLLLLKSFVCVLLALLAFCVPAAWANDHGGGASGPEPLKFVVNLGDPARNGKYLQVQMVFEAATPEIDHELVLNRPRIQHALILKLSSEDADKLLTLQGKKDLMADIVDIVNHLLHETEKTGVKDVFFTSFIIQ
jgi:flagellar FliL protein